ncbi:hypothetical protein ABRQ03_02160 [Pectobacterium jejuense]|uniref:hypothetical protein n=1 Tax=Pectobacterium TaxID=122277 RepID=UPI00227CDA2D|nr:hypothetical protein [Pectobacterium brasiliense]WGL26251.1 hypothetical protein OWC53_12710 [Pectobacterium brasiliense]
MKNILFLILVVLSSSSIADDKTSGTNDVRHPTVLIDMQSNIDASAYYDDEKNLIKLAEKISSLNKEKRDALEILDKVNSFYTNSFNSLQTMVAAMIALVGVAIPLVISFYQSSLLKNQSIKLQGDIELNFSNKLEELKRELSSENEKKMAVLEVKVKEMLQSIEEKNKIEINKVRSESLARIFHTIGSNYNYRKVYTSSAMYLVMAGSYYIDYDDDLNLNRIMNSLINQVVPQLTKNNKTTEMENRYARFMKKIKNYNSKGKYTDAIKKLEGLWRENDKKGGAGEDSK